MLRKLLRKITGKRSATEVFLDRAWTVQVAPMKLGNSVDFDGLTSTITVNANLPESMQSEFLAVLTANPTDEKPSVDTDKLRIRRLIVKATPR